MHAHLLRRQFDRMRMRRKSSAWQVGSNIRLGVLSQILHLVQFQVARRQLKKAHTSAASAALVHHHLLVKPDQYPLPFTVVLGCFTIFLKVLLPRSDW